MGNLNKTMLIGKLGADAEIRQAGQSTVVEFRVATSERWTKQDGTIGEETTWHTVILWNQPGVHQFLTKGREVYVEGSYKSKDWQDQQGNKRRDYYIKAHTIQLLGPKQQAQQGAQPQAPMGTAPAPQYQQPVPPRYQQQTPQPPMPPQPQYQQPQPPANPQFLPPQPPVSYPQPGQPGNQQYPPMNDPSYTQQQNDDLPPGF